MLRNAQAPKEEKRIRWRQAEMMQSSAMRVRMRAGMSGQWERQHKAASNRRAWENKISCPWTAFWKPWNRTLRKVHRLWRQRYKVFTTNLCLQKTTDSTIPWFQQTLHKFACSQWNPSRNFHRWNLHPVGHSNRTVAKLPTKEIFRKRNTMDNPSDGFRFSRWNFTG